MRSLSRYTAILGVLLFLIGLIISYFTRTVESFVISEGSASGSISLISVQSGMPPEIVAFAETAELEIRDVKAEVNTAGSRSTVRFFPPVKSEGRYMYLRDVGFSLKLKAVHKESGAQFEGVLPVRVLPPGREERVSLLGADLFVSLAPAGEIQKGRVRGRRYDLLEPLFRLRAADGTETVLDMKKAQTLSGLEIELLGAPYWVEIVSVKDGGFLNTLLGMALVLLALALRAFAGAAALFHK